MIAAVTPTQPSTREAIVPGLVSGYFEWSPDFSKHFRNVQLLRSLQSLHAYFTIFRIFYGDIYICTLALRSIWNRFTAHRNKTWFKHCINPNWLSNLPDYYYFWNLCPKNSFTRNVNFFVFPRRRKNFWKRILRGEKSVGYYGYSLWNVKQYHFPFCYFNRRTIKNVWIRVYNWNVSRRHVTHHRGALSRWLTTEFDYVSENGCPFNRVKNSGS